MGCGASYDAVGGEVQRGAAADGAAPHNAHLYPHLYPQVAPADPAPPPPPIYLYGAHRDGRALRLIPPPPPPPTQQPSGPPAAPPMMAMAGMAGDQQVQVVCPPGGKPGMMLQVVANGQAMTVQVRPLGVCRHPQASATHWLRHLCRAPASRSGWSDSRPWQVPPGTGPNEPFVVRLAPAAPPPVVVAVAAAPAPGAPVVVAGAYGSSTNMDAAAAAVRPHSPPPPLPPPTQPNPTPNPPMPPTPNTQHSSKQALVRNANGGYFHRKILVYWRAPRMVWRLARCRSGRCCGRAGRMSASASSPPARRAGSSSRRAASRATRGSRARPPRPGGGEGAGGSCTHDRQRGGVASRLPGPGEPALGSPFGCIRQPSSCPHALT
jgi:hypothetical protein